MMGRSAQISLRARCLACEALKEGLGPDLRSNCVRRDCGDCLQSQNSLDHDGGSFIFGAAIVRIIED